MITPDQIRRIRRIAREGKLKSVTYAYPSSPNAVQYGFDKSGCYCITLESDIGTYTIGAYATKEQAVKVADERPEPYSKYSL